MTDAFEVLVCEKCSVSIELAEDDTTKEEIECPDCGEYTANSKTNKQWGCGGCSARYDTRDEAEKCCDDSNADQSADDGWKRETGDPDEE